MIDRIHFEREDDEEPEGLLAFLRDATAGESPSQIVIVFSNDVRLTIDLPGGEGE